MNKDKENLICFECKGLLVQFHITKRNVKKYSDFSSIIKISNIFADLEPFLMQFESPENLRIKSYQNALLLAPQQLQEIFEVSWRSQGDDVEADPDTNATTHEDVRKICQKEQSDDCEKQISSECNQESELLETSESTSIPAQSQEELSSVTHKWNTNSSLTEEQKSWIWEDAQNSERNEGGSTVWRCSICSSSMKSSWVLRKHIRDVHIINPSKPVREKRRGKNFMEEVRSCRTVEMLEAGQEVVVWKCKRCSKVLKSESGCIKHLHYGHIKSALIDPALVADCRVVTQYEDGRPDEVEWRCPECKKLYRTSVGLKNHFKSNHSYVDFGSEKYQLQLKKAEERKKILEETEKQSEIMLTTQVGPRKIWQCVKCDEPRYYKSERGFKAHVRSSHLQNNIVDEDKISQCLVADEVSKQKSWKCSLCNVSTKTKAGFISHIAQTHPSEFEVREEIRKLVSPGKNAKPIADDVLQDLTEQVALQNRGKLKIGGYKYPCDECGLFFIKRLPIHVEAHKTFAQLVPFYQLPKCEECRIIYCSEEGMMKHLEWHSEDSEFIQALPARGLAYYGGKVFREPSGTAEDAIDEMVWKCGHCFAAFWEEDECVQHQMMLHMEVLKCPLDQLEFTGNRGISQFCVHMKNKHPELFHNLVYPCTFCKVEFRSIFEKLSHMKCCNEKKLECDLCGKKFFSKIKLAHHLKIESGLLIYECSLCDKKCANSMHLKLHVIGSHTNQRLYECSWNDCNKTYKTSAARASHMETHSKSSLSCELCEKVFKRRVALAKHMKIAHG